MTPILAAAFCTTGSGPTTCSRSPRCSTTPGAIGISWPPRVSDRRYRPRVQSSSDASARLRPAIFAIRQHHLGSRDRDVEELLVLDLLGARSDQLDDDLPRAGDRDHVAGLEHKARLRFDDMLAPTKPVDEQPVLGGASLGGRDRRSRQRRALGQAIGAQLELPPGGGQARLGAAHAQGLLELRRLRLQVDLQEGRGDRRGKEDHAGGAEDVADRIRHRDMRDQPCPLRLRQGQRVDRVGGGAHRGALRQRARHHARRQSPDRASGSSR